MPVSRLLREWSSREITELQAFLRVKEEEERRSTARMRKRMDRSDTPKPAPKRRTPQQSPQDLLKMLDKFK